MAAALIRDPYLPAVSSPLNPESCYQVDVGPRGFRRSSRRTSPPARGGPLSPTQLLLRRKAAVAWRAQVMQHEAKYTVEERSAEDCRPPVYCETSGTSSSDEVDQPSESVTSSQSCPFRERNEKESLNEITVIHIDLSNSSRKRGDVSPETDLTVTPLKIARRMLPAIAACCLLGCLPYLRRTALLERVTGIS